MRQQPFKKHSSDREVVDEEHASFASPGQEGQADWLLELLCCPSVVVE